LAAHTQHYVSPPKTTLVPQTLEGGAHSRRVTYLALDYSTDRQANLGKLYDLLVPTVACDLGRLNC
jgi:hypothetical protein